MIMHESSWGTGKTQNVERDVMKALYPGDYALWMLSGYNPLENKKEMSHWGTDEYVIYAIDETDTSGYKEPSMFGDKDFKTSDIKKAELEGGLGVIRDNIITVITPPYGDSIPAIVQEAEGEYLLYYDKITPNMSIACGIRYLAYKIKAAGGSEEGGVRGYNGGGEENTTGEDDGYVNTINDFLENHLTLNGQTMEGLKK